MKPRSHARLRGARFSLCFAALICAQRAAAQDPPDGNGAVRDSLPGLEKAVVPIVGGDTDVGIGAGAIGSLARPAPGTEVFRWKLEGFAFATVKSQIGGDGYTSPYQDFWLNLTNKNLAGGRLRLESRVAYTREDMRYFGIGNATPAPVDETFVRDFYTRVHPTVRLRAQYEIWGPLQVLVGTQFKWNSIDVPAGSTLLADASGGAPRVRELLQVDTSHGVHWLQAGLIYDSRDDEVSPSRGQHHRFELRGSPWQTAAMPYRHVGAMLTLSGFVPLVGDRVVLGARGVADVQAGHIPFYELARIEDGSAIGGPRFVRGVPSHRYYGKRKLLANVELRTLLWEFKVRRSQYHLGATGFFDSGRVWADLTRAPELDGTGFGLKYGTGAGLRLQKGKTFVLRADLAWSPDASPIAGYFLAEHIF